MCRYSEAATSEPRRRISLPQLLNVSMSELSWAFTWSPFTTGGRPGGYRERRGKFTVVLECAGLNATKPRAYCRDRGLYPEQVERLRQAAQDANDKPTLTFKKQKGVRRQSG